MIGHNVIDAATDLHTACERDFRGYIANQALRRNNYLIYCIYNGTGQ
jgi:hypothetical protein